MVRKPLVVITLPMHWQIKNILHSGVAALLQSEVRLQMWADESKLRDLEALRITLGLERIDWKPMPEYQEDRLLRLVRHLQKSFLFEHHKLETERIVNRSERGRRTRTQRVASSCVRLLSSLGMGPAALRLLTQRRRALTPVGSYPFGQTPDLLFITNPILFQEDPMTRWGTENQVPVLTTIPSWDNLTNKGVILEDFAQVMVWNEVMREEVQTMYPRYGEDQLPVVGVPRFDSHDWPLEGHFCRDEFLLSLGLDPERRTILCANTPYLSFRGQPAVARHLAESLEMSELQEAQLLVRCHPLDTPDQYDFLRSYPRVAVWPRPGSFGSAFGVNSCPPADDLWVLSAMIRHSDVVVNAASTIAIDAAVADRPILSVAYDGDERLDEFNSVASGYRYNHQRAFMNSGAGKLVHSREELVQEVCVALQHPEIRRAERAVLRRFATPGRSSHQMVKCLLGQI